MTGYFIELLNVLLSYIPSHMLRLFPMWKTRDVKTRSILIYIVSITLFQAVGLLLVKEVWHLNMVTVNIFKMAAGIPMIIAPFFIFRRRFWQNIFNLSVNLMYSMIPAGIGNYASESWLSSWNYPMLAANLVGFAIVAVTLPLLLYVLRRLFDNPHMTQAVKFWRLVWILPTMFFITTIISNSIFFSRTIEFSFVINRLLIYIALTTLCFILDAAIRQMGETEAAKRETEELAERNRFLDSLSQMKSEYLSNLGHEMKTPLTVLSLNIERAAELLARNGDRAKIEKAHTIAGEETDRIIRMAEGALELARTQESRARMETLDIGALITNCAETHRLSLEKRGNTLTLDIQNEMPRIEGTPDLLVQVISNLLSNANAHTENGEIAVEAKAGEGSINIVVRDNGEGIDEEILYSVFKRGVSGRGSTGLGLPLCKTIVESHGGNIELENIEGQGVTVTVTLPVLSDTEVNGNG
jgi:signal transduction histidine kinase